MDLFISVFMISLWQLALVFGIVFVLNLIIGAITPPVGRVMYTVCSLVKVPVRVFTKEIIPFLVAVLVVLMLITYVPALVLFLPNLLYG